MQVKLTQEFIQTQLRCPEGKPRIEFVDADCPGMYVLVSAVSPGVGTFFLRYKDTAGKTCHHKIGRTTDIGLADARKAAKSMRAAIALGQRDPSAERMAQRAALTLDEFWRDHYLPYVQSRRRSWARDVQLYARIGPKFGRKPLGEITRKEAVEFHQGLRRDGLAPATADHHAALLRRLLNLALEWEHVDRNVLAKFPLFRAPNQRDHFLTPEQLARLVEVLRTDRRRAVCQVAMFLLSTGARLNEALSAKWRDIDLPGRRWTILAETAKSKRTRSVPLNDSALMVLEEVGTRGKYDDVFVNPRTGKAYAAVFRVWNRIRAEAGLPTLRLHDLRHEFASQLVSGGRSLYEVQQLLGHASPVVTQRYAHLSTRALREAADAGSVIAPPTVRPAPQPAAVARPEAANMPIAGDGAEAPQREPEAGPRAA